jgi:hypothetical protein
MSELPDLHKAMTEALPVYEPPASLEAWAREEARRRTASAAPENHPRRDRQLVLAILRLANRGGLPLRPLSVG